MSAGGGYEAVVTARARCGWVMVRECSELQYDRRFPLKLKGAAIRKTSTKMLGLCETIDSLLWQTVFVGMVMC